MTTQLIGFELPSEFAAQLQQLLYKPDRNTIEVKALEAACAATHLSAAHLLHRCGAIASRTITTTTSSCPSTSQGHRLPAGGTRHLGRVAAGDRKRLQHRRCDDDRDRRRVLDRETS